jgi:hypothetical protein
VEKESGVKETRKWKRIKTAHEAWWFLYEHPKFQCAARHEITKEQAAEKVKGTRIFTDPNGNYWRVWPKSLDWHVIGHNLDIHYTLVDARGRVNDDKSKNRFQACWLEFGPIEWGYHAPEFETGDGQTAREYRMNYHDTDLDCGGKTFDEALIKLARLVMKKYGDYSKPDWV